MSLIDVQKSNIMDYIKSIYKRLTKDLLLDGSSNSATLSGLLSVLNELNLSKDSVFLDLGSGLGIPCITVAALFGCKCYGIEYSEDLVIRSRIYAKDAEVDNLCTFITYDINNLNESWIDNLKVTHAYSFDKAIIPSTWNHMHDILEKSNVIYIVSCFDKYINKISKKKVRLISSGESKTVYIFKNHTLQA